MKLNEVFDRLAKKDEAIQNNQKTSWILGFLLLCFQVALVSLLLLH